MDVDIYGPFHQPVYVTHYLSYRSGEKPINHLTGKFRRGIGDRIGQGDNGVKDAILISSHWLYHRKIASIR
jgi:hypothetical protein